jgi:DegV family protein with EDD domain
LAVKVITDSTAYLDRKVLQELGITEVSMNVDLEHRSFFEVDITNEEFYQLIEGKDKLPTSSQPSPLVFYNTFMEIIKEGHDILAVILSSDLSGSYNTAVQARNMVLEEVPEAHIAIIDSHTTVMELGLVALAAARDAQQGYTLEEVAAKVNNLLTRSKLFFIPRNLEYLRKGGRIGNAASLLGTLLQVTPILTVKGQVTVFEKVRTFERAVKRMLMILEEDYQTYGIEEIAVHHINCATEGQKLVAELKHKTEKEVLLSPIGPVIGLHVGPGTLGVAYILKERK